MFIQTKDKKMFLFAGLWSGYKKPDGEMLYTTTIITTRANEMMEDIHDRMPVILDLEQAKAWVDSTVTDRTFLESLLQPYDSKKMTYYPVSTLVNHVKNDDMNCIQPQEEGIV
jgi:putative SOS response-associated peptidase YedK